MKKIILILLFIPLINNVFGQSNNFPPNGDATINDGNLVQTGNHFISTQESVKLRNYLLFDSDGDFTGGNYFTIQDHSSGNYLRFGYGFQDNMVLNSNGNIGIGTLATNSLLTLRKSGTSTDLEFRNAGTSRTWKYLMETSGKLRIWGSTAGNVVGIDPVTGNFGLNIDNPDKNLHVADQGDVSGQLTPSNWQAGIGNYANNKGEVLIGTYDDRPSIQGHGTGTGYQLLLNPFNGNVGIGTTNANTKLHVYDSTGYAFGATLKNAHPSGHGLLIQAGGDSGTRYIMQLKDAIGNDRITVHASGSMGIGTISTGTHKLAVEGSIGAREIKVEANGWSDFVFAKDYDLPTLEEVETHISKNGHLPAIPSEADVLENGINLGEMDAKLLQKIEELTLYMIDMNKQVKSQTERIEQLEKENAALKEKVSGR